MPPADPGSLGDEALVNATFSHLKKLGFEKIGIISYKNGPKWKNINPDETIEMQDFFTNNSLKSNLGFLSAISRYEILYCLGADVLDGFYNKFHSLQRIKMMESTNYAEVINGTLFGRPAHGRPHQDTECAKKKPIQFDDAAAGDRMCDWLRAELHKLPEERRPEVAQRIRETLEKEFRL